MELFRNLVTEKHGMPELPPVVPKAEETFNEMVFGDLWDEAHMTSVCHYLRAGVHLKIPKTFRSLLPKKL